MNNSEEFKYQCLVRHVIKMRIADRNQAMEFLKRWKKKSPNLDDDVRRQWERGNRGQPNDWRYK